MPQTLTQQIRSSAAGRDWAAVLVANTVFISIHILEHTVEHGRAQVALQGVAEFISTCAQILNRDPEIVSGIDANITLHSNIIDFTGDGLMAARKGHTPAMTRVVESWLISLQVKALNTYGSTEVAEAWTCGTKRPMHKRSQIDYLCCTGGVHGDARPYSINQGVFRTSDHRPVFGSLTWLGDAAFEPIVHKKSWTGWQPVDEEAATAFKVKCVTAIPECSDLNDVQNLVTAAASSIQYDTAKQRVRKDQTVKNASVRSAMENVAMVSQADLQSAVHDLRVRKRHRAMHRNARNLLAISRKASAKPRQTVVAVEVNGCLSCDRHAWLQEAYKFGAARFGDADSSFVSQQKRLHQLESERNSRKVDGIIDPSTCTFDVLHARALLKERTSAGADDLPPEVFKLLPYTVVVKIADLFKQHLDSISSRAPESWSQLEYIGVPKTKHTRKFDDFRWLCKLAVFLKWYINSWRGLCRNSITLSRVKTYGFRRGHSVDDMTSLLRECLVKASMWKNRS